MIRQFSVSSIGVLPIGLRVLLAGVATSLIAAAVADHHSAVAASGTEDAHSLKYSASTPDRYAPAKPMAVVHFVKPARYVASSGETLRVSLTLMTSEDVTNISVMAKAETGIALTKSSSQSTGPVKAGAEVTVSFEVTALAEGRRYVNVVASAEGLTGPRMSSYSVPVEVGNINARAMSKSLATVVEDDQGNKLVLMPAVTPLGSEQDR